MANGQLIYPKKQIESLKPNTNYVLIKIDDPNEYRVTESGIFLHSDATLPSSEHANRMGVVVSVCDKLAFSTKGRIITTPNGDLNTPAIDSLENDTDLEVQKGDRVWFGFISGLNCTEFVTEEFETDKYDRKLRITYKLLKYDQLRLRQRGDEYRTLNGNVIVKLDEQEVKSSLKIEKELNITVGTVKFSGTPNRAYKVPSYSDGEGVDAGDRIIMNVKSNMDRPFEYPIHGKLEKGLRVIRGCDVVAKIKDEIEPLKGMVLVEEEVLPKGNIIKLSKEPSGKGTISYIGQSDELNRGDIVYFGKGSGINLNYEGKEYLMLRATDIFCTLQTN